MLSHRIVPIVVIALLTQSAMGQPRAVANDDYLIGNGMNKTYSRRIESLHATVARYLCCEDKQEQGCAAPKKSTKVGQVYTMTCAQVERPPLWFVIRLLTLPFIDHHTEKATRWARVGPVESVDDEAPRLAQLTIGVILERDGERLSSAGDHFFKPSEWAERLWNTLKRAP